MSKVLLTHTLRSERLLSSYAKAFYVLLLLLTVSCTRERSSQADLSLRVEPSNRPGVFTISGNTNLPDQSQVIVQGLRPLSSPAQPIAPETPSNYAILDRQTVVVSQGQWQATLKLWHDTPDGQYQEVWQASQTQVKRLQPSAEVIFIAAIDPGSQAKALKQQLERQGKTLEGAKVRFTTNEQWYIQAKQAIMVTPPTGKQTAAALNVPELNVNDTSSDPKLRSDLSASTSNITQVKLPDIKEKQTTAPLSFSQRFR